MSYSYWFFERIMTHHLRIYHEVLYLGSDMLYSIVSTIDPCPLIHYKKDSIAGSLPFSGWKAYRIAGMFGSGKNWWVIHNLPNSILTYKWYPYSPNFLVPIRQTFLLNGSLDAQYKLTHCSAHTFTILYLRWHCKSQKYRAVKASDNTELHMLLS